MAADNYGVQAPVPADFGAPDRVLWNLTVRQVAILAATGGLLWAAYHLLVPPVPAPVFAVAAIPVAALAAGVALGRRDGISMDRWLAAAVRCARGPRRLVAASGAIPAPPAWAPMTRGGGRARRGRSPAPPAVAPLRLPAEQISTSGVVDTGQGRVALTAATTVNFDLRSGDEQYAVVEGMGRWLNSLSGPVQIVVSTRRVDLDTYADRVDANLPALPHPALAQAAAGYAQFLRELAEDRDPLQRNLVVVHHAGAHADPAVARRLAEHTARTLPGLGVDTQVLHGGQVTDALTAACDPWRHTGMGRTTPDGVITGPSTMEVL